MLERTLSRQLDELAHQRDRYARGRAFERLIQQLLTISHYRTKRNPGSARPRQSDLIATYGDAHYLCETKWRQKPLDSGDLDALRSRVDRTHPAVSGILFSMSGFTKACVEGAAYRRDRLILLFDPQEIRALIQGSLNLTQAIRQKTQALIEDGKVVFLHGEHRWSRRGTKISLSDLPQPDIALLDAKGGQAHLVRGGGDFGHVVFTESIPDVDWTTAQGRGVGFDLHLPLEGRLDVHSAIEVLNKSGWITEKGRFCIQQSSTFWHGAGARTLLAALDNWEGRYSEVPGRLHHTEEVTYFDICEDGFYTLTFDVFAEDGRVDSAQLSAQLRGVPLDPHYYAEVARAFDLDQSACFRPLTRPPVYTLWNWPGDPIRLEHVGYIVEVRDGWVSGITVRNPFGRLSRHFQQKHPKIWEAVVPLQDFDLLVSHLSSYHPQDDTVDYYYLRGLDMAWTGDAAVFTIRTDWHESIAK